MVAVSESGWVIEVNGLGFASTEAIIGPSVDFPIDHKVTRL
jgi:hypothetical protein